MDDLLPNLNISFKDKENLTPLSYYYSHKGDFMDNLLLNLNFTDEHKKNCLPLAHRLIYIADAALKNGVFDLESEIAPHEENTYLRIGISLLSQGVWSDVMEKVFLYSFVTNKASEEELLQRLIISSSLLAIYNQNGAYGVAYVLAALLGEEYLPELLNSAKAIAYEKAL